MKIFGGFLHFSQLPGKMLQSDLLAVDREKNQSESLSDFQSKILILAQIREV